MSVVDDQLALLCAELPQLRSMLRTFPPRRELLEQAIQAGRRGEPVAGYLRRLGIAADDQPGTSGARKDSPAAVSWATGGARSVPGAPMYARSTSVPGGSTGSPAMTCRPVTRTTGRCDLSPTGERAPE
jgi:hypothetical protein